MKSKAYIENLAAKATRMLHMLYRVLKDADTKTKKMAYCTLVRPILEYGCAAWDPYLLRNINTLEQLQNRTLGFGLRGRISFTERTNIKSLKIDVKL